MGVKLKRALYKNFLVATAVIASSLMIGSSGVSARSSVVTSATISPITNEAVLRAVLGVRDSSLATVTSLNWKTQEPMFGTNDTSNYTRDRCSAQFKGPTGKNNVNWVLAQGGPNTFLSNGIKLRVRGTDGRNLPFVVLNRTLNGVDTCLKYTADSNGWILIPINSITFLFYGNSVDQWPKNPAVEVAQISSKGVGYISTIPVRNPVNKRSGLLCSAIKTLGYSKEALKGAISVIGAFAPGLGTVAASITSIGLSSLEGVTPGNPLPVATFTVANANDTQNIVRVLGGSTSKNFNKIAIDPINKKTIVVTWAEKAKVDKALTGVALVTTAASLWMGIKSVNKDYDKAGC